MEPVYDSVVVAIKALLRVYGWKVHTSGTEHIPRSGPAVIASNHIGYLDFVFVGYGAQPADRLVRFGAKKEVFDHRISGPLMRGMKHLPVDREGDVNAIMEESHRRLQLGQIIGMFPEGTISRSFVPSEAKSGAARMAMRAGVPLIPCAVWGTQRLWTKGRPRSFTRNVVITVSYGPPVEYEEGEDAREVTSRLMKAISGLAAELMESYPQEPASEEERWWLPAHLGGTAPTPEEAQAIARRERIERRARRKAAREAAAARAAESPQDPPAEGRAGEEPVA